MVNGLKLLSFKEACMVRNLLADDPQLDHALAEATHHATPKVIRKFFAIIYVHCQPSNPRHIWDRHLAAITEDYVHDLQIPIEIAAQVAFLTIETILQDSGIYG